MFYVIEVSTNLDGITAKAITEKNTKVEAEMLYHQIMASMLANPKVVSGICTVIDNTARQYHELTSVYVAS